MKVLIPFLSVLITGFERWDYASMRVKDEVWKLFLSCILNVAIICVIYSEFVLRKSYFRSESIMSQSSDFDCKEDQIATSFLKLVYECYFTMEIDPDRVFPGTAVL